MIYIYAGSGQQADAYAAAKGIPKQDYRIIWREDVSQFAGVRNPEVRFVGGWRDKPWEGTDYLRHLITARGGTIIEVDSW